MSGPRLHGMVRKINLTCGQIIGRSLVMANQDSGPTFEEARLEIERERLELEKEKLEVEKMKALWTAGSVLISALIAVPK